MIVSIISFTNWAVFLQSYYFREILLLIHVGTVLSLCHRVTRILSEKKEYVNKTFFP